MNRAMGLNLYLAADDSARGFVAASMLYPRS
jgi:hypothetical protein